MVEYCPRSCFADSVKIERFIEVCDRPSEPASFRRAHKESEDLFKLLKKRARGLGLRPALMDSDCSKDFSDLARKF